MTSFDSKIESHLFDVLEIATFLFTEPLLDHYLTYGKLTSQNMSDLQEYPYYENLEDVNYELEFIEKHPGKVKEYLDYIHPTATMVASFLHQQNLDKKELDRMIEEISMCFLLEIYYNINRKKGE